MRSWLLFFGEFLFFGKYHSLKIHFLQLLWLAILCGCSFSAIKQEKELDPYNRRVAIVSPDIEVSLMNAGGIAEPHVIWTQLAEKNLTKSIERKFEEAGLDFVGLRNLAGPTDGREMQLIKLHSAVGMAIIEHQLNQGFGLPTKKGKLEWSLGPGANYLGNKYRSDYALFVYVRDSYSSRGRMALIAVGFLLGVPILGGNQSGFASLVSLRTGDIVWFNTLERVSGDLRTLEGSKETVSELLSNFPK